MPDNRHAIRMAILEYVGASTCPRCLNCPLWCGRSIEPQLEEDNDHDDYRLTS